MTASGYEATLRLAEERPDLILLLRLIAEHGDEWLNEALHELVARGLLTKEWHGPS